MNSNPKITHAAVRTHLGVYAVIEPGEHYDAIALAHRERHPIPVKGEHGFLQNGSTFITAKDAVAVAYTSGQLLWTPQDSEYQLKPSDIWKTKELIVDNM